MLKAIGAGLIICASGACGAGAVRRLGRRVKSLSSLAAALELFEAEMSFRLAPLSEAARAASKGAPEPAAIFFSRLSDNLSALGDESVAEIWFSTLNETPELLLLEDETEAMRELGSVAGRFDLEQQRGAVKLARARVSTFLERALAEREKRSRLYGTLGLASGVVTVLLLI